MIEGRKILAIIPARGGSKRFPRKNILTIAGKPLLLWTIEAAKKSTFIDKVIVSTEDEEIYNLCIKNEIEVIKRPIYLATDEASTIDVVNHVIQSLEEKFDYIILLQPTSPLRNEKHIDEAINFIIKKNADAVISVCEVEHPIEWCNVLHANLSLKNFIDKKFVNTRSQDLPKRYRINGAIYIVKTERFIKENTFFIEDNIYAYIMDKFSSVDIDDEFDFKFAEYLIKKTN